RYGNVAVLAIPRTGRAPDGPLRLRSRLIDWAVTRHKDVVDRMVWVASIFLFAVLIVGAAVLLAYRRSMQDDAPPSEMHVPAEVLIARARAHDAAREAQPP